MTTIIKEQIARYIDKLDREPNTKKAYAWALNYFSKYADDLTTESYISFLDGMPRDLSPSTKRILRAAIMGLYDFYDAGDPAQMKKLNGVYFHKMGIKPVKFDRDAIEKIIKHCDTLRNGLIQLRDRAFIITLADSGFRISELAKLKRKDIDWREQHVVITGKRQKTAVVRLSKRSIQALRDYLSARAKMDGESGKALDSLPLFAQHGRIKKTKPMSVDGMRQSIVGRMKEAGVRVRIHDFRHYFVTIVLLTTGNLKLAQDLARHDSATTTQRYAHFSETELDHSYDDIFNSSP